MHTITQKHNEKNTNTHKITQSKTLANARAHILIHVFNSVHFIGVCVLYVFYCLLFLPVFFYKKHTEKDQGHEDQDNVCLSSRSPLKLRQNVFLCV